MGRRSTPRPHYRRFATHYSPHIFALALIAYLEENGVALRLDTLATYPDVEDGVCRGILVETVGGREYFPAKMVIDATGDATVCARCVKHGCENHTLDVALLQQTLADAGNTIRF